MDKINIAERATWENVSEAPYNQVIREETWVQLTTPGAPTPVMNGVFRCELDSEAAEGKIIRTIDEYRRQGLPFRWKTCPSSRPKNIDEILLRNGMVLKDRLFGLIAPARSLTIEPNPEVTVRELVPELKEDWLRVQSSAWSVPPAGIEFLNQNFEREFESLKQDKQKFFLAYFDGKPVASAGLLFQQDYGYLVGAATESAYRGKGVYRSLLQKRIELLNARELPAVIHGIWNTSAPICLRLGFEKVCEIHSFEPVV